MGGGWRKWTGIGLIGLSGVWFALMLSVPFWPFSFEVKALLAILFLVLMEVSFWLGAAIVGKQALSRFWAARRSKREGPAEGPGDGPGQT